MAGVYPNSDETNRRFLVPERLPGHMACPLTLLSESAVGPDAGQAAKIPDLFAGMHGQLGLVLLPIR